MDTATLAYWPADTSVALVDLTVGDALREAAAQGAAGDRAGGGSGGPGGSAALELRRAAGGVRACGARAAWPLRPRQPRRGVGHQHPRVGDPGAGRRPGGDHHGDGQSRPAGAELAYVLSQSRADGIFLVPAYRASRMAEMVEQVRGELPALREVISFADWQAFCAEAAPDRALPTVSPRRGGADPVHLRHDRLPQGRRAPPSRDRQQRAAVHRPPGSCARQRPAQRHAAVPHRRVRDGRARRGRHPRDAGPAALLRPRPHARADRRGATRHPGGRADDAHRHARPPGLCHNRHLVDTAALYRRGRRAAGAGRPRRGRIRCAGVDRVRADRGVAGDHPDLAAGQRPRTGRTPLAGRCRRPR